MPETLKRHLISAGVTAASALGVELMVAMNSASTWTDVGWGPVLAAASFVAARATLKGVFEAFARAKVE